MAAVNILSAAVLIAKEMQRRWTNVKGTSRALNVIFTASQPGALPTCSQRLWHVMLAKSGGCTRRLVGVCDDSPRPGGLALGKNRSMLATVKALATELKIALNFGASNGVNGATQRPYALQEAVCPEQSRSWHRFGTA